MDPSKLTSQTRREQHNNFTPSLHLVPFCQLCIPQNSLHALSLSYPLNEHSTQHCSLNSLLHKRQSMSSPAIKFHNNYSNIPYRPSSCTPVSEFEDRPYKLCHAQYSNYIAATHNISLCYAHQHVLHTQHYPPHALPSTILLCTQLTNIASTGSWLCA